MFATMIKGLFSYREFENKESFWDWYWNEQVPDHRYPAESLYECWVTFLHTITLGPLRFNVQMWWESKFNRKNFGYSYTFGKNGYFIRGNKWFVPCDGSFSYGGVDTMTEWKNGNPYFTKS
jgi:hypothetical protein